MPIRPVKQRSDEPAGWRGHNLFLAASPSSGFLPHIAEGEWNAEVLPMRGL